jgi:glycosyltransferase involved in cell wall biosynthesis
VQHIKSFDNDVLENISSKYIIGMVARFYAQKDHRTLILAVKKLLYEGYDISLVMVGGGDMLEVTKNMVAEFSNNNGRFIFLGPQSNVESIISKFDICVLSTNANIHREGTSNSIMEYMAMKKPVVATNNGGNKELISDNETGFLVQPFNVDEMADKLKILINKESLRKNFGKNGYLRIKNEFSENVMYENYLKLYEEVMK